MRAQRRSESGHQFEPGSCVEIVNNVFYDAQSQFTEIWGSYGGSPVAVVGNVFLAGPSTSSQAVGIDLEHIESTGPAQVYAANNRFEGRVHTLRRRSGQLSGEQSALSANRQADPDRRGLSARAGHGGYFPRDAFDERIVGEVETRTGHIRKRAGEIVMPEIGEPAYADADHNGMDDAWETENGADPNVSDTWSDADGDGMANMDTFLNYLHLKKLDANAD